MRTTLAICSAILLAGCYGEMPVDETENAVQGELAPNGKGALTNENAGKKPGGGAANGITYHGGPVMLGTSTSITSGTATGRATRATTILTDFAQQHRRLAATATSTRPIPTARATHVTNAVHYAGSRPTATRTARR